MALQKSAPGWLKAGFWVCIVIAVAVVVRRVIALAEPPRAAPSQFAGLDEAFASHAALTLAHILPALAFVLVIPFLVFRRFERLVWPERLFIGLGAVVGLTALAMIRYAIGGWTERSAVLFFDGLFLFALLRVVMYRSTGDAEQRRRWLLRAVAIVLGIATTRPVMGIFFATSPLTHWTPDQFFGIAFWIGFSINTIVAELWLRSGRRQHLAHLHPVHQVR